MRGEAPKVYWSLDFSLACHHPSDADDVGAEDNGSCQGFASCFLSHVNSIVENLCQKTNDDHLIQVSKMPLLGFN